MSITKQEVKQCIWAYSELEDKETFTVLEVLEYGPADGVDNLKKHIHQLVREKFITRISKASHTGVYKLVTAGDVQDAFNMGETNVSKTK